MKRILLVFAICYCSISMFAEHPVVLGVNLGEVTATEFKSILREKGWSLADSSEVKYEGTFAGYSGSELYIKSTEKTDKIAAVTIYLPEQNTWSSLRSNYVDMRSLYIKKYGKTKNDYSFFKEPYELGDGNEMSAVKEGKCLYACFWFCDGYSIILQIAEYQQVKIYYEDSENQKEYEAEIQAKSTDI